MVLGQRENRSYFPHEVDGAQIVENDCCQRLEEVFNVLGDCVDKGTLHLFELTSIATKSLHSSHVNPALNQAIEDTSEGFREIEVEHDPA
jgi:hypothetical protein